MARTGDGGPRRRDGEPEREPEPVDQWVRAGIPAEEADTWRNWRYRIDQAQAWRKAGVFGGLQAAQWSTAGVSAETVQGWKAAAIESTEAVTWHELGFTLEEATKYKVDGVTPSQAFDRHDSESLRSWSAASGTAPGPTGTSGRGSGGRARSPDVQKFMDGGVQPEIMRSYLIRKWLDDSAIAWAKEGIDAADAQLWTEIGLRPGEAGRLVRKGGSVSQTVRDWWTAGIPIDEVSDWIGAGLQPQEAADQRARGVTAEQAAALRALRDQPE